MRKIVTLLLLLISFSGTGRAQQQKRSADDLARRVIDVLAGPALQNARYFSFALTVEREGKVISSFPQRWDRVTGDYCVSGKDQDGNAFEIVMNMTTLKGRALRNGAPVTDPAKLSDMMTLGFRRFINDTFWLLTPLQMLNPDAHRTAEGERNDSCGRVWDVVRLTLEHGGLSPSDVYWAWINRDTAIVEEWDMKLQSMKPDDPPVEVIFHDFRRIGGLLISTRREVRGRNQTVRLDDLEVLPATPKGAFDAGGSTEP